MKKINRIILAIISLSLLSAFFTPLWEIDLEAPQYPEGLCLEIHINKIGGDLNTVNGLNHYVGMKFIEPDSIKELKLMPYILEFLILSGLIVSITGSKKLFYIWFVLFLLLAIAGALDFYLWEYDYGHNLNPEAAIKIPGMTYQPPLLGTKQLLNFTVHSFPGTGGYILILSGFISVLIMLSEIKRKAKRK
jgi:copper chaperone NosL